MAMETRRELGRRPSMSNTGWTRKHALARGLDLTEIAEQLNV